MFRYYLILSLRHIRKNKVFSVINIAGLAIGMACFILIALHVKFELSFDRFHQDSERIYRIDSIFGSSKAGPDIFNTTPAPLAGVLKSGHPGIEDAVRLRKESRPMLVQGGEHATVEERFFYADPGFLTMFAFPLISGNPGTALDEPYSIVISEEMSHKLFQDGNPLGKTVRINKDGVFTVTGVITNAPANSHLQYNFLASFSTLYQQQLAKDHRHSLHWNASGYYTYVKLKSGCSPGMFEERMADVVKKYRGEDAKVRYVAEALGDIHLYQDWGKDIDANGDIRYVYFFASIGIFILLIACVNYINISSVQSLKRAKEAGLRKAAGANRGHFLSQYLVESLVCSLLGFCLAAVMVEFMAPLFQSFHDREIQLSIFADFKLMFGLTGILLLAGCIAGAFPAIYSSAFQPAQILKGKLNRRSGSILNLRNFLVVFQFVISAVLIVSTIVVYSQLHYLKTKKLGMRTDHIVTLEVLDEKLQIDHDSLFHDLSLNPRIRDVSASQSLLPGTSGRSNAGWDGKMDTDLSLMCGIRADRRFAYLYEIPVIEGHNYAEGKDSSLKSNFLLNRSALKALGWKKPVGKRFQWNDTGKENGEVIGVVDDFHFFPLDREIEPLVIELVGSHLANWQAKYFSIKIGPEDLPSTLAFIEEKWKKYTEYPLQLEFFDQRLDEVYQAEKKLGRLFTVFAVIALLLGCMGIYGLALSSFEQRRKEIGIRKVLGSSITQIIHLLTKETAGRILAANLVALPISWYLMNGWLSNFAYKTGLDWWIFLLAGGISLVIALATASFLTIKAAATNPADSLRYE